LLERLIGLATRLEAFVQAQALGHAAGTEQLLVLFDSVITFRARYQRHDDLLALTELLVLDRDNPRAFAGVLRRLRTEIGKLPGGDATRQPLLALLPAEGTILHAGPWQRPAHLKVAPRRSRRRCRPGCRCAWKWCTIRATTTPHR
jgi:hypothetical protein